MSSYFTTYAQNVNRPEFSKKWTALPPGPFSPNLRMQAGAKPITLEAARRHLAKYGYVWVRGEDGSWVMADKLGHIAASSENYSGWYRGLGVGYGPRSRRTLDFLSAVLD